MFMPFIASAISGPVLYAFDEAIAWGSFMSPVITITAMIGVYPSDYLGDEIRLGIAEAGLVFNHVEFVFGYKGALFGCINMHTNEHT